MQSQNLNKDKTKIPPMYDPNEDNDPEFQNGFVFRIDKTLLIDPRKVFVSRLIGEGSYSKVYEGLQGKYFSLSAAFGTACLKCAGKNTVLFYDRPLHLAYDHNTFESKPVAVKVIQPMRTSDVIFEHKQRFQREVTLQSRMNHGNIVKFIGASVEPAMFIITELMKGDSLQKYLLSIRPKRLDLKDSLSFTLDISRAMEYLHENGVIHRDLKPGNLLLTEDKTRIKVGDFGLAREEVMDEMTCEAGTYRWMAPELFSKEALQVGMKKHYDHKVDVYSFAIVLWELLTNKAPFKGRDNLTVAFATAANKERPSLENIPEDIVPLLQSCWSEDPALRPEFSEITKYLKNIFQKLWPAEMTPPQLMEIESPRSQEFAETGQDEKKFIDKRKKTKNFSSFRFCFTDCLSE